MHKVCLDLRAENLDKTRMYKICLDMRALILEEIRRHRIGRTSRMGYRREVKYSPIHDVLETFALNFFFGSQFFETFFDLDSYKIVTNIICGFTSGTTEFHHTWGFIKLVALRKPQVHLRQIQPRILLHIENIQERHPCEQTSWVYR